MNNTLEITTAARRIARQVNEYNSLTSLYFDKDGNVVDTEPTDMYFANGFPEGTWVIIRGTKDTHMTYADAQEALNDRQQHFEDTGF